MYIPKSFREADIGKLHRLIRSRPLATLVVSFPSGISADHLPLCLDAGPHCPGVLCGHIARANPLADLLAEQGGPIEALAIFHGASSYISPSWYPAKSEHGKVVPTWNYVTVHARGQLRLMEDGDWLRTQLEKLTEQQEAGSPAPWAVTDAPPTYIERLSRAIVGVELAIEGIEGKWKGSQNQSPETRAAILRGLRERDGEGDAEMAALMESLATE